MRRCLFLIFVLCCTSARADIFQDNKDGQMTSALRPFEYRDQNVPAQPVSRFNFKDNLFNQIQSPFFNSIDTRALMQSVTRSPLMLLQYSSPAGADLFKHYQIAGQMRLDMFYRQAEDIQKRIGGDPGALSDQARMECLKNVKIDGRGKPDLVKTMLFCSDGRPVFADLDPRGGQASANVLDKIFNRLRVQADQREMILAIIPRWEITPNGYKMNSPSKRIGDVFGDNRNAFLEKLHNLCEQYRKHKSVDPDDLQEISLPGMPLTEQSLRDWLALEAHETELALGKIASQLAYVKTAGQYDQALEFLNRVLMHPSIKEGYKMIARQALGFVTREEDSLTSYRAYAGQYAAVLGSALEISEKRRLEIARDMEDHYGR